MLGSEDHNELKVVLWQETGIESVVWSRKGNQSSAWLRGSADVHLLKETRLTVTDAYAQRTIGCSLAFQQNSRCSNRGYENGWPLVMTAKWSLPLHRLCTLLLGGGGINCLQILLVGFLEASGWPLCESECWM